MQNDKELFEMIKEAYPQIPSKESVILTEEKLRLQARSMNKKGNLKRLSLFSTGVFLFAFAFSWIFFFDGLDEITTVLINGKDPLFATAVKEQDPIVLIYHSHYNESFIPEVNSEFSETTNITLVGKELTRALTKHNISTILDDTNITAILKERNLLFSDSYVVSREVLKEKLKKYDSIKMIFDIHRDSQKRAATTLKIDGEDYAKVLFVISKTSDNYEENRDFAKLLHEKLELLYPELSRGVIEKGEYPSNSYNQDLQSNSVLLEIGGIENTLEESYRTTDAIAKVIKEVIEDEKIR